ncbi:hypothetical protein OKW45_006689 [Paraburkholderia sp. WSM4175]
MRGAGLTMRAGNLYGCGVYRMVSFQNLTAAPLNGGKEL